MSKLKEITDANFAQEVIEASKEKPVVVDFWAAWCGPCRMLSPVLEEIAAEDDSLIFGAVDVDANPQLSLAFKIRSIPTVLVIKDGEVATGFMGARPKDAVKAVLKEV